MSPEDPNNPGLNTKNPDLSSVPLPDPTPTKSPYAPVGGTLGDVADDMVKEDETVKPEESAEKKPERNIPTAGIADSENNRDVDSANSAERVEKKKLKIPKKVIIFAAIGLVVAILIVILVIIIASNQRGDGPGSNGKTGSMFETKSVFIPKDEKKDSYALYDGHATGEFEYEIVSHFIDGYALVRKGGKFGIIDEKGAETVAFGKYDNITEYGGLYGATKDGSSELIDGQGRVIKQYKDEFKKYGEIERADRAAYTIFQEGNKKYSIYSPRGEKLASFESDDVPTISSTNTIDSTSTTAVIYSDGAYIYDDAGQEVMHLERKIAKKYLITDVSADRNTIILSTSPGKISISQDSLAPYETNYLNYDIPKDNRYNATIVNKTIHEYDNATCSAIIYEKHYSTNDRGFLACLGDAAKGYMYIDEKGELTSYTYNGNILNDTIFPLSTGNYILKENANSYSLYSGGKKITSFKFSKENDIKVNYSIKNTFANNYVVLKDTAQSETHGLDLKKNKYHHQYELALFDEKGKKVCSFDDSYFLTGQTTYIGEDESSKSISGPAIGFNRSGIGTIQMRDRTLALVNDKCQQIGNQTFSTAGSAGFWGNYLILVKNDNEYVYLDQDGKMQKSLLGREKIKWKTQEIKGYAQWEKYNILAADYVYKHDPEGRYDRELLFYGKKTGIPVGYAADSKIVDTDTCLMVRALVGTKTKKTSNSPGVYLSERYDLIETRAVNNSGEVIYEKKEEVNPFGK